MTPDEFILYHQGSPSMLSDKDTKVDLKKVIQTRNFQRFEVVMYKGEGEFAERASAPAYIDVNEVEAFYEVFDELRSEKSCIIELETGSTFRVLSTLEEVLAIVNG